MSSGTMGLLGEEIEGGAFGGEGYNWEDKVWANGNRRLDGAT